MGEILKKFEECGLLGCLNDTGVTSENYKIHLRPIEWKHIMDEQPENGRKIVQVDRPFDGHYCMGMRVYDQPCTFEEVVRFYREEVGREGPDFWWVYASDFPFPGQKKGGKGEGEDQGYYGMD